MFDDLAAAVEAVNVGDAVLLDVRTIDEHQLQAAHSAVHLDVYDIETGADPDLDKDSVILVYCRSGGRAGMACSLLAARGYTKLQNVGGLNHWLDAGGKVR